MRQRKDHVEVRDIRDDVRLLYFRPLPLSQITAAGTVPVPAGTGPHPVSAAVFAVHKGVSQVTGFAGNERPHDLKFLQRYGMVFTVCAEMGSQEITDLIFPVVGAGCGGVGTSRGPDFQLRHSASDSTGWRLHRENHPG